MTLLHIYYSDYRDAGYGFGFMHGNCFGRGFGAGFLNPCLGFSYLCGRGCGDDSGGGWGCGTYERFSYLHEVWFR